MDSVEVDVVDVDVLERGGSKAEVNAVFKL